MILHHIFTEFNLLYIYTHTIPHVYKSLSLSLSLSENQDYILLALTVLYNYCMDLVVVNTRPMKI